MQNNIGTNKSDISQNKANITNKCIIDISVNKANIDNNSKDLKSKNEKLNTALGSVMRFLQSEIDMSSGVVSSTMVFPPLFSNNENPLISLKKVEVSGVSVDEITSAEYMKLNTYVTGNVSKNIVNTLALDIDAPFKYGYNELKIINYNLKIIICYYCIIIFL